MSSETCARYGERARQCTEAGELLVLVQALGTHHNAVDKQHAPDAVPTHPNVAITQNQHQCAAHASPAPQRSVSCDSRRTRKSTGLFCADATAANATRPAAPTATTIVLLCTCPNSPDWGQGLRSTSACAPYSTHTHTHTHRPVFSMVFGKKKTSAAASPDMSSLDTLVSRLEAVSVPLKPHTASIALLLFLSHRSLNWCA
jgi:hypothetical protein